jgi:hypothetical protein
MESDWILALEQNAELSVTQGSLAATADAVRKGADLRLFLIAQGYEETLYFQQTYAGQRYAARSDDGKNHDRSYQVHCHMTHQLRHACCAVAGGRAGKG